MGKAAFPFGFGLTYSSFSYSNALSHVCGDAMCVEVTVRNDGTVAAGTVAQLYFEFPAEAQQPRPILKGFNKTGLLLPGSSLQIVFRLLTRDISFYENGGWTAVKAGTVHIGESSEDFRQSLI